MRTGLTDSIRKVVERRVQVSSLLIAACLSREAHRDSMCCYLVFALSV